MKLASGTPGDLLRDVALRDRMTGIGAEIRAKDGVAKAADAIESVLEFPSWSVPRKKAWGRVESR